MNRILRFPILIFLSLLSLMGCSEKKNVISQEAEDWAQETLSGLSLEKKVAQLICTDVTGNYLAQDDSLLGSWIRLAGEHGIGGFVFYGGTPNRVAELFNRLQEVAEIPLLISADFEGGPGQQVAGASEFPGHMAFAAAGDEDLMYRAARVMAEEGRAMGIHLSYTPVTDITLESTNPQESVRSLGGDIDLNGRLLKAYVKAYHELGMLTTAKHFPGRGNMKAMTEYPGFNYLTDPAEEIQRQEFKAFQNAVDAGVDFIMTEHIAVPSVADGSLLPASVEPKLTRGIIRNQLEFKGMVTTDDLWYEHVIGRFGKEEVAVRALMAGHDLILKPKDPVATIAAVVAAVKEGRISEAQIDQSVRKLLVHKALLGLHKEKRVSLEQVNRVVGIASHQELVQEVADRSVSLLRNEGLLPLKNWNPRKTVHITIEKEENQVVVDELLRKMDLAFDGIQSYRLRPGIPTEDFDEIDKASAQADLIILSFFVQRTRFGDPTPIRPDDLELLHKIIAGKPGQVLAMSFGNPYLIQKIPQVPVFVTGYGEEGWYGNQKVYFESLIRLLKGQLIPSGKLPVRINEAYPIGFGLSY